MITIVDYGMGNHGSIRNMLGRLGYESAITSDPDRILNAEKLILPGVGHFGRAMGNLESLGLIGPLEEAVLDRQIPVLGICLGMQLLTLGSEEGQTLGLGWIDAQTRKFTAPEGVRIQIPHMGWNTIEVLESGNCPLLASCPADARFYFVHSYMVRCNDPTQALAVTIHGQAFHSVIGRGHIMGVQFHPEKSHKYGYRLLADFCSSGDDTEPNAARDRSLVSRTDVRDIVGDQSEMDRDSPTESRQLPARVIPLLLLKGSGLVKTVRFAEPKYVGDPRNAVKIFNEKEVDELVILDIEATVQDREPAYDLLAEIIDEAFMPVAYGGGLHTLEACRRILTLGAEKVLLNTAALEEPDLIRAAAEQFGSQSVVAVIDVRKQGFLRKRHQVCARRGQRVFDIEPAAFARKMQEWGAGEILLQSIDQEGTQRGMDLDLIGSVADAVDIPVIASGGAGSLDDLRQAVHSAGASAVAAGSLFVFQGPHRAVLINYPKPSSLRRAMRLET